ncbi:MAG: DUF2380 domain-containing protein [Candidatus Neomarinimicrobiota bacterium]|nr:MAG: DUF2380 domain-containing protein [Candidatus Neomarinimicrobiota bacterium]
MTRFTSCLFLLLFWGTALGQTSIAVLEFSGKNVSSAEASALTDRLRTELFRTGRFKVVEREMMEEILQEQGFQQSGCASDECIVEMGRLIGVDQIIAGSVSKVGTVYSISARVVSVETGEIVHIATYDHEGQIGDLLKFGMRDVAYQLSGQKEVSAEPATPVQESPRMKIMNQTGGTETLEPGPRNSIYGFFGGGATIPPSGLSHNYYVESGFQLGGGKVLPLMNYPTRVEVLLTSRSHSWEYDYFYYDPWSGFSFDTTLTYTNDLQVLEVDAMPTYQTGSWDLYGGLGLGVVLSAVISDDAGNEENISDSTSAFIGGLKKAEVSLVGGVNYWWKEKYLISWRVNIGLNPLYSELNQDVKYISSMFRFGYRF